MDNASLNGVPFRLNPMAFQWPFKAKTSVTKTVGGFVVQVFGAELGDITVMGSFGAGGWREQLAFLDRMKKLADAQAKTGAGQPQPTPFRFLYPNYRIDYMVWLKDYSSPDGAAVVHANMTPAPRWQLVLQVEEDLSDLKKVATDAYIARLSAGLGWSMSPYNGPQSSDDVQAFLTKYGASSIAGFLDQMYGLPQGTTAGDISGSGGSSDTGSSGTPAPHGGRKQ